MNRFNATWHNGQILLDGPVNWPEGKRLVVTEESPFEDITFMTEEEQSDDPEEIERWIAELEAAPVLEMSPLEEAEWQKWREAQKAYNLEAMRREFDRSI